MKTVKRASQLLKAFADTTRLRIVNLLFRQELNVNELCLIMDKKQSIVSKHLAQLRLLDIVSDRKAGLKVYYYLPPSSDRKYMRLLGAVTDGFQHLKLIRTDTANLKRVKNGTKN
jgi:ArsR family transcriptional regulator, arsenate/arsenite/antimonite-responsive transcriptional repressor